MRRIRSHGDWIAVSSLAVATMLAIGSQAARAQSFQGTGTVVGGSASITTGTGTTLVEVGTPTAVINWLPDDTAIGGGPITFQPATTTATFANVADSSTTDFAVLNRILPADASRPVLFDGNVVSEIRSLTGAATRGGTVFFYSPGGILVGANAVFDVGNLGLTTSDLPYDPQTGAFSTNGVFQFQQAAAGTSVEIAQGAQIHVGAPGVTTSSYLAIVAPRIVQDGVIDVNGSAALVAADAATIRFSPDGLFDIQIDQGTSSTGTVLSNSGAITGAAGSASTFIHRIYMVAVPRNTAITMAITSGSTLGFDIAGAADVVGNTVVLSAGTDVIGGDALRYRSQGGGSGQTALDIGAITATSAVRGTATGLASLTVQAGEVADFASDLALAGAYRPGAGTPGGDGTLVSVTGANASLTVGGNFDVSVIDSGSLDLTDLTDISAARVVVDGGTLAVNQSLTIHADRFGLVDGGSATGGTAVLSASNAALVQVGGAIDIGALGTGASPDAALTAGGGSGGTARLDYGSGAQVSVASVTVVADGRGGLSGSGYGGGGAIGGTATIDGLAGGGSLTTTGSVNITANGYGSDGGGCITCIVDGGIATGGTAQLTLSGSTAHSVDIGGGLQLAADGQSGAGASTVGADGAGGTAQVVASGGAHALAVAGATSIVARGYAGQTFSTLTSGSGIGGTARIVTSGAAITLHDTGVSAFGFGAVNSDGGAFGQGTGGTAQIRVEAAGGSITGTVVTIDAQGQSGFSSSGASADGGMGWGGTASVDALAGTASFTSLTMNATGLGGDGSNVGGAGQGGLAAVRAQGGAITVDSDTFVTANAIGGHGASGGNATGGLAQITVDGGSVAFGAAGGTVNVLADAAAGGGDGTVAAGTGTGGTAQVSAGNGTATFANSLVLGARGQGGASLFRSGGQGAAGGVGQGGTVILDTVSDVAGAATITTSSVQMFATGTGGAGASGLGVGSPAGAPGGTGQTGGAGGDGLGGVATVNAGVANGTLLVASLFVDVSGQGGVGGDGGFSSGGIGGVGGLGGTGGRGFGGVVSLDTAGALAGIAATGRLQLGSLGIYASGFGGQGGAGGSGPQLGSAGAGADGLGGSVTVRADRGGSLIQVDGATDILADGYGANGIGSTTGIDGGKGTGGTILFSADGTTSGNQLKFDTLYADASGVGGVSLTAAGGESVGGSTQVNADGGLAITANTMTLRAIGFGGSALASFTGGTGTGGAVSARIGTGASLGVVAGLTFDAAGVGGASEQSGGIGGAAQGGSAVLRSLGGAITLTGDATVGASAFGGAGNQSGVGGAGGSAIAGLALVGVGDINTLGNGGTLSATGNLTVVAYGFGGSGYTGGLGQGGSAIVTGQFGTVTLGTLSADAAGFGGAGLFGGTGGDGAGGEASVVTFNALAGATDITIGSTALSAYGRGGVGGDAPADGSAGGTGGRGLGGNILALGSAGNGRIALGDTSLVVEGRGGIGGAGGANDGGLGGTGGMGGAGLAGTIQAGTQSGLDTGALNAGSASFGQLVAYATGLGGDGGAGGFGATGTGAGGTGGDAVGGGATLLVRGSPVTLTSDGFFEASAFGGTGGAGSAQGAGGNATVGLATGSEGIAGASLELTSRYLGDAQRGSLDAQSLTFQSSAVGGLGGVNGTATTLGAPISFDVRNADLTALSLSFTSQGPAVAGSLASPLTMLNGSAVISGGFGFTTGGDLVVSLDSADILADQAQIAAGNWIESGSVVTAPGAIHTTGVLAVQSGGDIVGDVSLLTASNLSVFAPGSIRLNDLSAGGPLVVSAGQSISLASVSADAGISVLGGTSVSLAAVDANGGVDLSAGTALTVTGPLTAVDRAMLNATDALNAGAISVTGSTPSSLRELAVLASNTIVVGDIVAGATRLFGTQSITAGTVGASDLAVLGGGDIALAGIWASGRVLLADAVMADAGGSPLGSTYDFDALFAASPARATGAITVTGLVSAGSFVAATSQTFDAGALMLVDGDLSIDAAQAITIAGLSAGGVATIAGDTSINGGTLRAGALALVAAGDILLDNLSATGGNLTLQAGGGVSILDLAASGDITASSVGDLAAGVLSAGGAASLSSATGALTVNGVTAQGGAVDLAAVGQLLTGVVTSADDVSATSGAALSLGDVQAGGAINLTSGAAMHTDSLSAGGGITIQSAGDFAATSGSILGGPLTPRTVTAGEGVTIASSTGSLTMGPVSAGNGTIDLRAPGAISVGGLTASGDVTVSSANGSLVAGDVLAGGALSLTAGTSGLTGALSAAGDLVVVAEVGFSTLNGSVAGGGAAPLAIVAGGSASVSSSAGALVLGDVTAQGGTLDLTAADAITAGALGGNGTITVLSADGALALGSVASTSGAILLNASGALDAGDLAAALDISAQTATGDIVLGALDAGGAISLTSGAGLSTDALTTGSDLTAVAGNDLSVTGAILAGGSAQVLSSTGALTLADVAVQGGALDLSAAGPITAGALGGPGAITVSSTNGAVTLGNVASTSSAILLNASGALDAGNFAAASDITAQTVTGDIVLGALDAGGGITLTSPAGLTTGAMTAGGDLTVVAGNDLSVAGAILAGGSVLLSSSTGALTLGDVTAQGGTLELGATGRIDTGRLSATGDLRAETASADMVLGNVDAGGAINLLSGGALQAGDVSALGNLRIETMAGDLVLGALDAGLSIDLISTDALQSGDIFAQGGIAAHAATTATVGSLAAATGNIALDVGGTLTALDLGSTQGAVTLAIGGDATMQSVTGFGAVVGSIGGDASFVAVGSDDQGVQLAAGGALSVTGGVLAKADIALVAGRDLQLGVAVGQNIALLADGNVSAGQLIAGAVDTNGGTAPGNGGVLVAGRAMLDAGGRPGTIDVGALLAATPARAGGTVSIGGASGGSFAAVATGDVVVGQIDASSAITVDSDRAAIVAGLWSAPSIALSSRAITIVSQPTTGLSGGLDAGVNGSIVLRSRSDQGVVLGDGAGQAEYAISAAEWATIRSGSLTIRAKDTANAIDMLIGNLEVTGPEAGSTIDDPNGVVRFQTENPDGISGAIRITGNLSTRGFLSTNALEFNTGRFELDAGTGSLGLYGTGGQLAGILHIRADGIHVASAAILDRLAVDPFYSTLETDLDRPAQVQRPDGVLAAGAFQFVVGRTLYVQNTGTLAAPAGFLTAADGFRVVPGSTSQPVRMIVNGKFTDGTTILSGVDAYDAFKANQQQITIFADDSRLNGCLLSADSCRTAPPEVPVEVTGPTISTQITVLSQNGMGDTPRFVENPDNGGTDPADTGGDEGSPEQQEQADKATAGPPIVPPTPLIDMRPLNPPGRIEEPVAGSGNPALMGAPINENSAGGAQ